MFNRLCQILMASVFLTLALPAPLLLAESTAQQAVRHVMPAVVGIAVRDKNAQPGGAHSDALKQLMNAYRRDAERLRREGNLDIQGGIPGMTLDDINVIGTGFIVDPQGTVITAQHVVQGAKNHTNGRGEVFILMPNNRVYRGAVATENADEDLAVVNIQSDRNDFPVVTLGDSDKLEIAESVYAIGNPFGFTFSVSGGIVSALNRTLGEREGLIQTDAAINPGNSGGPLINDRGEVIGVNHAIVNPAPKDEKTFAGLGFAVPINKAKPLFSKKGSIRDLLGR